MKKNIAIGFTIIIILTVLNGCYVRDPAYDQYYHDDRGRYDRSYYYRNKDGNYNHRDGNYWRKDRDRGDNDSRYRDGDGQYDHH